MSKAFEWAKPLGVSPADLDSWSETAESTDLLISWCVKSGKIDANQYLTWARNHYSLPSLTSSYFAKSPSSQFFTRLSSMPFWSENLLPICEWDGVLFIACAEPLPDAPWSFPVQFVLASPYDLAIAWKRLNAVAVDSSVPIVETVAVDVPAGLSLPEFPAITEHLNDKPNNMPDLPDLPEASATSDFEAPEGLSPAISFKLESPRENPVALAFPLPPKESPKETPLALHPVITDKGLENYQVVATESDAQALPAPPKIQNAPKLPADEEVHRQFINLSDTFTSLQLLEFINAPNSKSGQLKVIAYKGSWAPKSDVENQPIGLEEPSIFRIASRTRLPYHGYVVPNEANEKFFQNWGVSEWPEHVTLAPIKDGKTILGILLGIGTKSANTQDALKRAEESARVLVSCFISKKSKVA